MSDGGNGRRKQKQVAQTQNRTGYTQEDDDDVERITKVE